MRSLFKIENLSFSFSGSSTPLFSHLNIDISESKLTLIMGSSGSGKSTFLRFLNRLLDPQEGQICFRNKNLLKFPVLELRRRIALVSPLRYVPDERVENYIVYGPHCRRESVDQNIISKWLNEVLLPESILNKKVCDLSSGELQRVNLVRALLNKPDVLLLDEPTANLDLDTAQKIESMILEFVKKIPVAVIWVTHDRLQAQRLGVVPIEFTSKGGSHAAD